MQGEEQQQQQQQQQQQEQEQTPFEDAFTGAGILADFQGSDHAPVFADLTLPQPLPCGARTPPLDLHNRRTGTGARACCLNWPRAT
jgi:hypothetical protein